MTLPFPPAAILARRLAFAALVLVGCASARVKPEESAPLRASQLFPLAVGNRWTYDAGFAGARQALTVAIVAREGEVFQDSRGLHFIRVRDGLRDAQRYLLKEPLVVGTSWSSVIDVTSTEHYKVVEIGASLDTPAGHFDNCVRVEARNPAQGVVLIAEQIYCPDVGLAKVTTFVERGAERGPPQFLQELTSYKVAADAPTPTP